MIERRVRVALAVGLVAASLSPAAAAQRTAGPPVQMAQQAPATVAPPGSATDLQARYDAAFQAMLHDPTNLDRIFDYATVATQSGDYEGAIGAYERMLIFNPDLPQVRFELGRLYFLLKSWDFAAAYLRQARDGNPPADIIAQIDQTLAEIDRQRATSQFTGTLSAGIRTQSNANAGPGAGTVRVFGIDVPIDPTAKRRADTNGFLAANLTHIYDFEAQSGVTLESTAALYGAQQFIVHRYSLALAELTVGPRLPIPTGLDQSLSLRPYVIGNSVELDYRPFFTTVGGGLDARVGLLPNLETDIAFEYRHRSFHNSALSPTLSGKDGDLKTVRALVFWTVTPVDSLLAGAQYSRDSAHVGLETYDEYSLQIAYSRLFAAPWSLYDAPWTVTLQGVRTWRPYDQPDQTIDPGMRRYDRELNLGVSLQVPLDDNWWIQAQFAQSWVLSNLPNFKYNDTTGTVAAGYRF